MEVSTLESEKLAAKFTLEERQKFCNAWSKTNISRSEFIRRNKLPKSFHYWCNQLLTTQPQIQEKCVTTDNDAWLQILPKNGLSNTLERPQTTVEIIDLKLKCNNLEINFKIPHNQVITFIKELSNATAVIR